MKRTMVILGTVAAIAVVAGLLATSHPAEAKKTFSDRDLDGTYLWVNLEIRTESTGSGPVMDYCSGFGTMEFYGDGTAHSNGTHRCKESGVSSQTEPMSYAMSPDGTFLIWEDDSPAYTTHCRLVDNGRMVICDGTSSNPEIHAVQAVAVKQ